MKCPAKYLVIEVREILDSLDHIASNPELPVLDIEAILSCMFEAVEKPNLSGRLLDDSIRWIMEVGGLTKNHLGDKLFEQVQSILYVCLIRLRTNLGALNPYCNGLLLYRHKQRHGLRNVILEYQPPLSASNHHSRFIGV